MNISRLLYNRFVHKGPFFLVFYVTSRCNAHCRMCYNWENVDNWQSIRELSIDEIGKITRHIGSLQQLTLSGGEPFLRDDIDEICRLFKTNSNVQFITIPTNGLLPDAIGDKLPKILTESRGVHFRIGLGTSEIHEFFDELYGVRGGFERHRETERILRSLAAQHANLSIDAGIVCSSFNIDRIRTIVDYVVTELPESNPILMMVRGEPRSPEAKNITVAQFEDACRYARDIKRDNRPLAVLMNGMRDMVNDLIARTLTEQKAAITCRCGERMAVIYDDGEVYPCELLNRPFGNLRDFDYDLGSLLGSRENRQYVKNVIKKGCFCSWECALNNNIALSTGHNIQLIIKAIRHMIGR